MDERARQTLHAVGQLLDRTTPWLSEIGSWIFGGLVAVNLVVVSALPTVGPVDAAVRISVTAFACALPLSVAGIIVLRLTKDLTDLGVDNLALQAFKESGFPDIDAYFPAAEERAALLKRRASLALRYSLAIAAIRAALTLAGLVAALWHMAWWIGSALLVTPSGDDGTQCGSGACGVRPRAAAGVRMGESAETAGTSTASHRSHTSAFRDPRYEMTRSVHRRPRRR